MHTFRAYVDKLQALVERLAIQSGAPRTVDREALAAALDGQPGRELRRVVPIAKLRRHGAFFTGAKLASYALQPRHFRLSTSSIIGDFTCGAGDLLVACSAHLPIEADLSQTIMEWGKRLIGRDLQPEFVRAAKARLVLAAIQRGALPEGDKLFQLSDAFPNIQIGCGRTDTSYLQACSHIVLNPPFTIVKAPVDCNWATGSVNAAALFVESCLLNAKVGAQLVAILPEVLRCGTRYQRWRTLVETLSRIKRVDPVGQFDTWTDVDVFIMEAEVRSEGRVAEQADWGYVNLKSGARRVGDLFKVSVGPVVPFRAKNRGPWMRYFYPNALPAWTTVDRAPKKIRFRGKPLPTPLVVVRRTSRLGDRKRAIGTIITGDSRVAIENHLVVLRPRDGKLATCERLLQVLRSAETDAWLDRRIRCRHLTVKAVCDLPWLSENK